MSEAGQEDLLQIAQVLKANGTDGQIVLGFRDILPEDMDLEEPVFIFFDGLPVPFFISSFEIRGKRALIRLNGINNLEDAEEVAGRGVFARKDAYEFEEEGLPEIIGWTLKDDSGEELGIISDFEDIPGNPCIYVAAASGQVMLPLHEDLIISIDDTARCITMQIPSGLI